MYRMAAVTIREVLEEKDKFDGLLYLGAKPWTLETQGVFVMGDLNSDPAAPFPPSILAPCALREALNAGEIEKIVGNAQVQLGNPTIGQLFDAFQFYLQHNAYMAFDVPAPPEEIILAHRARRAAADAAAVSIHVNVRAVSIEQSRQFYEDELAMFKHVGAVWESACALRPRGSNAFELNLGTYYNPPGDQAMFFLVVANCDREFARLRAVHFASGGRIVPDKDGRVDVFEYPGGKNFLMEDPAGNRFVIHEDYAARLAQ